MNYNRLGFFIIVLSLFGMICSQCCINQKGNNVSSDALQLRLREDSLQEYFNESRQRILVGELKKVKTLFITNNFMLYPSKANRKEYDGVFIRFNILEDREQSIQRPRMGVPIVALKDTFFVNIKFKEGRPLTSDTVDIINNIKFIKEELKFYFNENELESIIYVYKNGIFTTQAIHMRNAD